MTLEEYQKVLEEKRKALEALKTEERKVEVDKELAAMQQLSNKKASDDIFVKLVIIADTFFNILFFFSSLFKFSHSALMTLNFICLNTLFDLI